MKKLTKGGGNFEPISKSYQFKPTDPKYPNNLQLDKGKVFVGTFEKTFVKTVTTQDGEEYKYTSHFIKTVNEGTIALPGCTSLNQNLVDLSRGTKLKIVFVGKGKAKNGKKAPFLFDIYELSDDEFNEEAEKLPKAAPKKAVSKIAQEEVDADEDTEEELDEEVSF